MSSDHTRLTWRSDPRARTGFPLAAVVWMPTGPALATVTRVKHAEPPVYLGWIDGRAVTGQHDKLAACCAAVRTVVAMAHDAHARRMIYADA